MGQRDVLVGGRNEARHVRRLTRAMGRLSQPGFLLAGILVGAALLRFLGLDYGLPHPLASDEEILVGGTLRMAQTMSFVPTLDPGLATQLYYPVGLPYAYLLLFAPVAGLVYLFSGMPGLGALPGLLLDNLEYFFLAARLLSAAVGIAAVYVLYRLGTAMFRSPWAGLICAALLATSWFHVMLAHFARHWSATVFLTWLTVWLAWALLGNAGPSAGHCLCACRRCRVCRQLYRGAGLCGIRAGPSRAVPACPVQPVPDRRRCHARRDGRGLRTPAPAGDHAPCGG